jgi:hypothetical protein
MLDMFSTEDRKERESKVILISVAMGHNVVLIFATCHTATLCQEPNRPLHLHLALCKPI